MSSQEDTQPLFGTRFLTADKDVFQHNSWDSVEWDEEQRKEAEKKAMEDTKNSMSVEKARQLEEEAHVNWNKFYQTHQRDFFKDRHWISREFSELSPMKRDQDKSFLVFEIGCGVGNTMIPILEMNTDSDLFFYGCDFSAVAIDLLKKHASYDEKRAHAFVLDATKEDWQLPFEEGTIDVVVMIFTLSAIDPSHFDRVINNIYKLLRPGGLLLFRDYGRYDLAQLRFKSNHCISDNFYMRGDGTRAYFFQEQELDDLFKRNGLTQKELFARRLLLVNRGKQLKMYRVWIQAKYIKPC